MPKPEPLTRIPRFVLEDRILGAWVGKSYGAAMGDPLEFAFNVQEHALRDWLVNEDGDYYRSIEITTRAGQDTDSKNACQCTAVWVTGRRNLASEGVGIALGRVVSYAGRVAALPSGRC